MIVIDLRCPADHRFEGWFASAEAFETQRAQQMMSCPSCGQHAVERVPSAPAVHRSQSIDTTGSAHLAEINALLHALQEHAASAEDVGERFADEARRIHYEEAPARSIRGHASGEEVLDLLSEGISVLPVPNGKDDLH